MIQVGRLAASGTGGALSGGSGGMLESGWADVTYGPQHNRSVAHPFLLAAFHSKVIGDCSTLRLSRSLDHFR